MSIFSVVQDGDVVTIVADGALTIQHAREFRDVLSKSLMQGRRVQLDLERICGCDLACLQLVCSAIRTAAVRGAEIVFCGGIPPVIREACARAAITFDEERNTLVCAE